MQELCTQLLKSVVCDMQPFARPALILVAVQDLPDFGRKPLQTPEELSFAENPKTAFYPLLDVVQWVRTNWQLIVNLEPHALFDARRLARAWRGTAVRSVGRGKVHRLLRVADADVETPLIDAVVFALGRLLERIFVATPDGPPVLARRLRQAILLAQLPDHVEAARLANHQIVAATVDRESIADDDVAFAMAVTAHLQAAYHPETVHRAVIKLVLLAEISLLKREVRVGEQLAAKVLRAFKAG
jgi:hypothetical protein